MDGSALTFLPPFIAQGAFPSISTVLNQQAGTGRRRRRRRAVGIKFVMPVRRRRRR